jgi:hypothetical protein
MSCILSDHLDTQNTAVVCIDSCIELSVHSRIVDEM